VGREAIHGGSRGIGLGAAGTGASASPEVGGGFGARVGVGGVDHRTPEQNRNWPAGQSLAGMSFSRVAGNNL
jgi:hypothetical protein